MILSPAVVDRIAGELKAGPKAVPSVERRREPRTRFSGQATIIRCSDAKHRVPTVVSIRDISPSGIGITHEVRLDAGERFILILPPGLAQIARGVLCTVVNSRPSSLRGFEIGAVFTALIRLDGSAKARPTTTPATSASLPVEQVIKSFREEPRSIPNNAELAAMRSIEAAGSTNGAAPQPAKEADATGAVAIKPTVEVQSEARPAPPPLPATNKIKPLLTREECIKRTEQAMQARTLSGVVAQVITLATSPRGDMSDLASLIARDPMLSARILQAANSVSYTSTRGVVSSIPDAVRNIGCAAVRDIAATFGVFDAMPASEPDGFNPIRCWQHSFAVATLCQRLAPEADGGTAYLVGLCHDLGEILFHSHFGPEYRKVLEAQAATGKRRDELERIILGMAHAELVVTILRCMGLPEAIRAPIEEFHASGLSGRALSNPMARVLRLAEFYANGVLLASSGQSPLSPLSRPECRGATGKEAPERPDGARLRAEILSLTAMLARLSAKEEAELMMPLYPRKQVRVLLVRDPSLSTFDPIQESLEWLAEVVVESALPAREALRGFAGVVVVSRSTSAAGFTAPEIVRSIGDAVPTLWLTGRIDGGAGGGPSPVAPTPWPFPLSRAAEFVQSLKVAP